MRNGLFVSEDSLRRLLVKLADIGEQARNKLERKAIRQALSPTLRTSRRRWRQSPSRANGTVRRAVAKATQMRIGRVSPGQLSRFGVRSRVRARGHMAGNLYVSYKARYGAASLAHLIEFGSNTAGPTTSNARRAMPNRRRGTVQAKRISQRVFRTTAPKMRAAFVFAMQQFLIGQKAKDVRTTIRRELG